MAALLRIHLGFRRHVLQSVARAPPVHQTEGGLFAEKQRRSHVQPSPGSRIHFPCAIFQHVFFVMVRSRFRYGDISVVLPELFLFQLEFSFIDCVCWVKRCLFLETETRRELICHQEDEKPSPTCNGGGRIIKEGSMIDGIIDGKGRNSHNTPSISGSNGPSWLLVKG